MIRVLIVDDELTIQMGLRYILERDPEIKVIGEARNGEKAVALCRELRPDIVTMDILMPGMGGYEAIRQIMSETPCPIVVLTGIDSKDMVDVSFKALAFGALTVIQKPKSLDPENEDVKRLVEHIKIMADVKVVRRNLQLQPTSATPVDGKKESSVQTKHIFSSRTITPKRLVAIGASTGGPPALQLILSELPSNFPLPIVIVQHISHGFIAGMANWLSATTNFKCKVGDHDEIIRPGIVYLAPDDKHTTVRGNGSLFLDPSGPIGGHRPSVNALFDSVAKNFKAEAVGILLTGMGRDGAQGLDAMRRAGAWTIAQDETSSVVFGMPNAAIELNAVDEILNLNLIAPYLKNITAINAGKKE